MRPKPKADDSYIVYSSNGQPVSFVGLRANDAFRAACLASAVEMASKGRYIEGGMSDSQLLLEVSLYTQKPYPVITKKTLREAAADLKEFVRAEKTAIPRRSISQ